MIFGNSNTSGKAGGADDSGVDNEIDLLIAIKMAKILSMAITEE